MPKKVDTTETNTEATEVAAPPAPPKAVKSEAQKIWEEIQNLEIQMFGLPEQTVAHHCTPVTVEPNSLYLITRSSATLPSLEAAIGSKFTVELADKFIIVKRAPKPLFPKKK